MCFPNLCSVCWPHTLESESGLKPSGVLMNQLGASFSFLYNGPVGLQCLEACLGNTLTLLTRSLSFPPRPHSPHHFLIETVGKWVSEPASLKEDLLLGEVRLWPCRWVVFDTTPSQHKQGRNIPAHITKYVRDLSLHGFRHGWIRDSDASKSQPFFSAS